MSCQKNINTILAHHNDYKFTLSHYIRNN